MENMKTNLKQVLEYRISCKNIVDNNSFFTEYGSVQTIDR